MPNKSINDKNISQDAILNKYGRQNTYFDRIVYATKKREEDFELRKAYLNGGCVVLDDELEIYVVKEDGC
jgi:hypothetical protein